MNRYVQRALMAYRPLYLRGLLMDGQPFRALVQPPPNPSDERSPSRQRMLLVASAALRLVLHSQRNRP